MQEAPLCDSEREVRDLRTLDLWEQMNAAAAVGDDEAWMRLRNELYAMYEKLSFSFGAGYFSNKRLSPDDVRQCCRIGVIRAIDEWNPDRGSLTTSIGFRVSLEIRSWCRAEGVYTTSQSDDQTDDSQQTCQDRKDRPRRKCDLTYVSFETFRQESAHWIPADFTDIVMEQSVPGHEESAVMTVTVEDALSVLDPEKREIVERYYGLSGHEEHTLRDLEPLFHVSYQTIKNRIGAAHKAMAPLLDGFV